MEATYINATQFSISGDHTEEFIAGRRIRANCDVDGYKFSTIISSSYSAPNTTVTIEDSELTSNLIEVHYGLVSQGATGSLPVHSHDDSEGQGGTIRFLDLEGTPATFSGAEGKYLYITNSGIAYGAEGVDGTDGIDGQNGLNFYVSSGAPDNEEGEPSEGYIDYAASNLYVKDVYTFGSIVTGDETFWSGDTYLESAGNATAFDYDNASAFELTRDVWWGIDFGEQRTIRKMHIWMGGTEELHVEFHNDTSFTSPVDTYDHDYNTGSINEDIILLAPIVCRYVRFYISDRYMSYSNGFRHLGLLDTVVATWDLKHSIIGPQGDSGADGADGADGATWHVDTVDPQTADGADFDLWLTETDKEIFVKDEPGWSSNLALSKSTTSSTSSKPASNAVDGSLATEWQASATSNVWMQVDLTSEYQINRLTLTNRDTQNSIENFELRASNSSDMSGYTVLVSDTHPETALTTVNYDFLGNTTTFRYYRLHIIDAYNWAGLAELELYSNDSYEWRSLGTISGSPGAPGQDAPDTFIGLSDTPTTYSGIEGNYLRVTASGIQAVDGVVLTAPDLSEWVLKVTVSGVLYTEAYSG